MFVKNSGESSEKIHKTLEGISRKYKTLGEFILSQHNLLPNKM
jgi:hypothetical protein